jgi:transposase
MNNNKLILLFNEVYNKLAFNKNNIIHHTRKFKEDQYFEAYLNFLNNSIYYSRFNYSINNNIIHGKYLNQKVNTWTKLKIFENMFKTIIDRYVLSNNLLNFKYLSIDSQFTMNKFGSTKNMGRNKQYKSKYGIRTSCIVDKIGIPLIYSINKGSSHDSLHLINMLNKLLTILPSPAKYKNSKKYNMYFLGDAGYDTKDNINFIKKNNITPVVLYNKRKTINQKIINEHLFTNHQTEIYKKRIVVENSHAWREFIIPRLGKVYDKNIDNIYGQLYLSTIYLIFNRNLI